jgi:hypothetical protein
MWIEQVVQDFAFVRCAAIKFSVGTTMTNAIEVWKSMLPSKYATELAKMIRKFDTGKTVGFGL